MSYFWSGSIRPTGLAWANRIPTLTVYLWWAILSEGCQTRVENVKFSGHGGSLEHTFGGIYCILYFDWYEIQLSTPQLDNHRGITYLRESEIIQFIRVGVTIGFLCLAFRCSDWWCFLRNSGGWHIYTHRWIIIDSMYIVLNSTYGRMAYILSISIFAW